MSRVVESELVDAVKWVASTVNLQRAALPVLAAMRVGLGPGEHVEVAATDLATTARAVVGQPSHPVEQTVLVPGQRLAELVGGLGIGGVDVTIDGERLHLRGKGRKFSVQTMALDDYPRLSELVALDPNAIDVTALEPITRAASTITSKVESGVHLRAADGVLRVATTDEVRLHWRTVGWGGEPFTALVPPAALRAAAKVGKVSVACDGDSLTFAGDQRTVTTRLLMGEYRDVDAAVATLRGMTPVASLESDAKELADAITAVALAAERSDIGQRYLWIDVLDDGARLRAREQGGAITDGSCDVPITGGTGRLSVLASARYMLDALACFDGPVRIDLLGDLRPMLLTSPEDDSTVCAIMAVRP